MNIQLRYFASIREALGTGQETWNTQAQVLSELRLELMARGGAYAQALGPQRALRAALNHELCDGTAVLTDGCEVAFFPPVTGG
jgi:molybdopterin synthase sulfur carrier subunit